MSGGAEAGVLPSITFGVVSAFMGQLVAFPLETVSRRMQVCLACPCSGPSYLLGHVFELDGFVRTQK